MNCFSNAFKIFFLNEKSISRTFFVANELFFECIQNLFFERKNFLDGFSIEFKIWDFLKRNWGTKVIVKWIENLEIRSEKPRWVSTKIHSPAPKGGPTRAPKRTFFEKISVKKSSRHLSNKNCIQNATCGRVLVCVCFQFLNQSRPFHINIWKCFCTFWREIKIFIGWNSFSWVCSSWILHPYSPSLWISMKVLEYVFLHPNGCLHHCKALHMQCMWNYRNLFAAFIYDLWWYKIELWGFLSKSSVMTAYPSSFLKNTLLKTISLQGTS